eukprot:gene41623-59807_t
MEGRLACLPAFEAGLDAAAEPWVESLGAVKYWAGHMRRRRRRLDDRRGLNAELDRFDELYSRVVRRVVHRDPHSAAGPHQARPAWRGCTGVPDSDQLTPAGERAPLPRPQADEQRRKR